MRRLSTVTLAVLLAFPLVGPVAAADPSAPPAEVPSSPDPTPAVDPSPAPSAPSADPTPTPVPDPTSAAEPAPAPDASSPVANPEASPAAPTIPPTPSPADGDGTLDPTGRFIVVLEAGADTAGIVTRHRQREGVRAERQFSRAVRGFSARLDAAQRAALLADPSVVAVVPDEIIEVAGQVNPTGVSRVGARKSDVAGIDNVDERVDADVAIVDTGVALHSDLNVVGGVNCTTSDRSAWADQHGHGTHVAGTVAALDNDYGVVGVAPGARIWAVRILNSSGFGYLSWYVCGLDWILAQRDPSDASRPLIESVNMSVAKTGSDDRNCGYTNKDVLHQAICRVTGGGITVVAAAANERKSAANYVPAAYNEVITVSALADTDGRAGGLGGNLCYSWGGYDKDDTFADFSNYGSDVDIIAPGKCIWSTTLGGYGYSSGTSMAAPAVAGAVALYKASRPAATPGEVRESLRYLGNLGWDVRTDPDSVHEPLLDVARVSNLGSFSLAGPSGTVAVSSRGGTLNVPLTVNRGSTFFERVRFTVSGVPSGWSVAPAVTSLYGWTGSSTTLRVTVPNTARAGDYQFQVTGSNWGRTRTATVRLTVASKSPFTDLSGFETAIDWLYREGITNGCSPTRFCPDDPVTRIQMAMFMTRAMGLPLSSTDYFDDDDGRTGESSVNALAKAGLTGGCGPRRYCPSASVTRIQMAQFLVRALDLPPTSTDYFDDDDGMTGESSVNALAKAGLTGGCGPRRYCPSDPLTREQMAALLYRAFGP